MKHLAALLIIAATPAVGQSCFPYDAFQEGAASGGLSMSFSGMTGDQLGLLQVYTHTDGRWVVVSVTLNGVACLLTGGEQSVSPAREPEGEDS